MRPQPLGAVLSLSVDLESATGAAATDRETTEATVERLAGMLETAGVAAVWATGDPVGSRLVRLVRDTCSSHEIALLAERSVAGFARRLAQARAAGIPVTTLVAGDDALIPSGELLAKHCISAVRAASPTGLRAASNPATGLETLRFGLWQLSPALRLGGGSTWAHWMLAGQLRRAIDRCTARGTLLNLAIDAPALSREPGQSLWRALGSVLRHIERRQHATSLRVLTIREIVGQLSATKSARSAQSILRAA